jgi:PKD repeat protein
MVARNFCGQTKESIHIPITVSTPLFAAQMFVNGSKKGCAPYTIEFFNNSTNAENYYYTIYDTDGNIVDTKPTANDVGLPYTFTTPGTYYVTVTATNSCGNPKESSKADNVITIYALPTPDFNADVTSGCKALSVTFTNTTPPDPSSQADAFIYDWDFGDGSPHSSQYDQVTHTFTYRNTPYTVTLTATNRLTLCSNIISKSQYITVTPPPGTFFSVRPDTLTTLPNYSFSFEDNTTGTPVRWNWVFGDGQVSSSRNPSHTYADTGRYLVTLRVFDQQGCDSTYSHYVRITGIPGQLYMPNAFMPNASSTELRSYLPKGSGLATYRMQIFNKWGELLWETNKLDSKGVPVDSWDGTFKGAPVPQGVYIWQASATYINGSEWKGMSYNKSLPKRSGIINLIR